MREMNVDTGHRIVEAALKATGMAGVVLGEKRDDFVKWFVVCVAWAVTADDEPERTMLDLSNGIRGKLMETGILKMPEDERCK